MGSEANKEGHTEGNTCRHLGSMGWGPPREPTKHTWELSQAGTFPPFLAEGCTGASPLFCGQAKGQVRDSAAQGLGAVPEAAGDCGGPKVGAPLPVSAA